MDCLCFTSLCLYAVSTCVHTRIASLTVLSLYVYPWALYRYTYTIYINMVPFCKQYLYVHTTFMYFCRYVVSICMLFVSAYTHHLYICTTSGCTVYVYVIYKHIAFRLYTYVQRISATQKACAL